MDLRRQKRVARVRPKVADSNRKRAARACWRCRNHKSRCIPAPSRAATCLRCLNAGVECTSADEPFFFERSNITRSSVRNDENAHADYPRDANVFRPVDKAFHSSSSPKSVQSNEAAHLLMRSSHQTHYEGEVSNTTFLSKIQNTVVVHSRVEIEDDEPTDHENIADLTLVKKALEGFPSANEAEFLVTCFFRHSEANYYFMDRTHFQERLNRLYLDGLHSDIESDASLIALALMVFAMGSQFAHLQTPETQETQHPTSVYKQGPGMVFYLKAKFLLPDVITQCTMEGIQVCFLTALFLLPSNSTDLSYVYHGMAMKMAIASGLHRKTSDGKLAPIVVEVRNRLWWSLYVSERRLSIILDRPETIKEEDIDTPFPEICEALDLLGGNNNLGNLQASIRLMSIFNRAVKREKSVPLADSAAESTIPDLNRDLQCWMASLPTQLQPSNLDPGTKIFRGAVHLHMSYHQIVIFMGRPSLLGIIQMRLYGMRAAASQPLLQSSPSGPADESLSRACVSAAYQMAGCVRYLAESHRLARYSYTDFNYCTSAAIIVIINEIVDSHPCYHSAISVILRSMEFLASGARNAKKCLRLIQNLRALIATIKRERPLTSLAVSSNTDVSGYEKWEHWMAEAVDRASGSSFGSNSTYNANSGLLDSNESGSAQSNPTRNDHYQGAPMESTQYRNLDVQDGFGKLNRRTIVPAGAINSTVKTVVTTDTSEQQIWENNVAYASLLSWFDDFNMLGLGDFPSLVFPECE